MGILEIVSLSIVIISLRFDQYAPLGPVIVSSKVLRLFRLFNLL